MPDRLVPVGVLAYCVVMIACWLVARAWVGGWKTEVILILTGVALAALIGLRTPDALIAPTFFLLVWVLDMALGFEWIVPEKIAADGLNGPALISGLVNAVILSLPIPIWVAIQALFGQM